MKSVLTLTLLFSISISCSDKSDSDIKKDIKEFRKCVEEGSKESIERYKKCLKSSESCVWPEYCADSCVPDFSRITTGCMLKTKIATLFSSKKQSKSYYKETDEIYNKWKNGLPANKDQSSKK